MIPSKQCPDVAEECGKKGVKGLIVISAGFKEIGGEGIETEKKMIAIGKKYNMRILGPNVLGVMTPTYNCTFAKNTPNKGPIAFLS